MLNVQWTADKRRGEVNCNSCCVLIYPPMSSRAHPRRYFLHIRSGKAKFPLPVVLSPLLAGASHQVEAGQLSIARPTSCEGVETSAYTAWSFVSRNEGRQLLLPSTMFDEALFLSFCSFKPSCCYLIAELHQMSYSIATNAYIGSWTDISNRKTDPKHVKRDSYIGASVCVANEVISLHRISNTQFFLRFRFSFLKVTGAWAGRSAWTSKWCLNQSWTLQRSVFDSIYTQFSHQSVSRHFCVYLHRTHAEQLKKSSISNRS